MTDLVGLLAANLLGAATVGTCWWLSQQHPPARPVPPRLPSALWTGSTTTQRVAPEVPRPRPDAAETQVVTWPPGAVSMPKPPPLVFPRVHQPGPSVAYPTGRAAPTPRPTPIDQTTVMPRTDGGAE